MKITIVTAFLLLLLVPCTEAQRKKHKRIRIKKTETITKIQYEVFGRRGRTELTITKDSAICINRTDQKFKLLTSQQWASLTKTLQGVSLKAMPAWVSPTRSREYDGALHCKLVVTTATNVYESQYFDSGKPMRQLKELYDKAEALKEEINTAGMDYQ